MKKYLLLLFSLILVVACTTSQDLTKKVYVEGYIFTSYTRDGFMFTPEKYNGKYESIGLLSMEIYPQIYKSPEVKSLGNQYGVTGSDDYDNLPRWSYRPIDPKEVLDSLYNLSKKLGANAVVSLSITSVSEYRKGFTNKIPGVRVSGFAIKRLEE